jgi:Glycosyl hydrolase catalytic core
MKLWVTEFATKTTLPETESYFNYSINLLDSLPYVERYSYFGACRSKASNIGLNVSMLDDNGKLTAIGKWYLGGNVTDNIPTTTTSPTSPASPTKSITPSISHKSNACNPKERLVLVASSMIPMAVWWFTTSGMLF